MVKRAMMVERLGAGPLPAYDVQVFVSPSVTFVLADETAILTQFRVAAAGDDMQRDPPAGEAGPVRDQMDKRIAGLLESVAERITGCAFRVANTLGHGFVEMVYENALA